MAKEIINIGTEANDGTGDQLRAAFDKTNLNFTEVYDDNTLSTAHLADATLHRVINDAGTLATELFSAEKIIADLATKAELLVSINTDANAAYELVLGDASALVRLTFAGATTLTIPANGAVAFPIGTVIEVTCTDVGATTIAITTDTLVGATTIAQNTVVKLTKVALTEWLAA